MPRNLKDLTQTYGEVVRPEDISYLQWKLDHAQGVRIAIKRLVDQLEKDKVILPKRSRRKLRELITASDLFQNYQNPSLAVQDILELSSVCKTDV